MQSNNAIVLKGLKKSFKDLLVLDGVDFSVKRGSVLALLGPNGAGKTTTVRILSTLLAPDAGSAEVAGYDVVKQADKVRSVIGLTGQYAAVDEYLTGRENLQMIGRLYRLSHGDIKRRSDELLEQFDLQEAASRPVRTYSGGMRRRIDLAMSLIASPPVLFLDEPTTGLDPRSRLTMWARVKELAEQNVTVLLTTQHMEEADHLADKIVVIDHGQVIAEGTANELKAKVGSERLEFTIAPGSDLEAARRVLGDSDVRLDAKHRTVTVATKNGPADLQHILQQLQAASVEVDGLSLHRPTLDDVFLALTGHTATADNKEQELQQRKEQQL